MSLRTLALVLFTSFLFTVSAPGLLAQSRTGGSGKPQKETPLDKEERKGLRINNDSSEPWYVGMDSNAELNGTIEIMKLNKNGKKYEVTGKLEKGKELHIPVDSYVLISPVPPKKWMGLAKTGVDFSAKLYLRDSKKVRLNFTMDRASGGATEAKTCTLSFPDDFDPSRFERVFLWTLGEGALEGKYVSPLSITGLRLPPPKGKARQEDN